MIVFVLGYLANDLLQVHRKQPPIIFICRFSYLIYQLSDYLLNENVFLLEPLLDELEYLLEHPLFFYFLDEVLHYGLDK